jgi:type IV secretion system protein VirB10
VSLADWFRRGRALPEGGASTGQGVEQGPTEEEGHVAGERGFSAVERPGSLQSRMSNALALGLMGTLGVGFLGWYYIHSFANRSSARLAAHAASRDKAKGEMTLPPLGRVDPPAPQGPAAVSAWLGDAPEVPPEGLSAPSSAVPSGPPAYPPPTPATKTPQELLLERQLAGPAFASPASGTAHETPGERGDVHEVPSAGDDLDTLLRAKSTPAATATVLPTQRLLLPKGAFIDCTLETAIDSSLPGMTTCIVATDTFSADGSVVLIERGTKLVGETRGQVHAGSSRVFVLWTEARTPTGVIVPLDSPGTDELGRSGLPGEVNRHFFERFGAAILISIIDGTVQAASERSANTVIVNPSTSGDVVTEVLKSTVAIPPTVTKPQGDRIQVLVARDLDFRSVYELHAVAAGR